MAAEAAERAADVNGARTAWEQAIALYGGDLLPSCEDEAVRPPDWHWLDWRWLDLGMSFGDLLLALSW